MAHWPLVTPAIAPPAPGAPHAPGVTYGRRLLVLILGLAAATAAHLVDPAVVDAAPVLCPFRRLTGLPCPGCGMTRAVVALAHGDVSAALAAHPLGPLVVAGLAIGLAAYLVRGSVPRLSPPLATAGLAIVLGVWVSRLALLIPPGALSGPGPLP